MSTHSAKLELLQCESLTSDAATKITDGTRPGLLKQAFSIWAQAGVRIGLPMQLDAKFN